MLCSVLKINYLIILHVKDILNISGTFFSEGILHVSVLMMALIKWPQEKRQFPSGVICIWNTLHWFHMLISLII